MDDVCVPPPNSRLAQLLRHQQSQSLPGTKNKQSGRQGPSGQKLRYAYSSANAADNGAIAPLFYHLDDEDEKEQADLVLPQNNATHHNNNIDMQPSRRRKRMRMIRFMDRPFSSYARRRSRQKLTRRQRKQQNRHQDRDEKEIEVAQLLEYEQRKAAWAAKYTSVTTLRSAFGTNKNRLWGDFDPVATRKLYHTLLPRALLELRGLRDMMLDNTISLSSSSSSSRSENSNNNDYSKNKIDSDNENNDNKADLIIKQELKELAPLAYQARVAAKKYARERSRLPGRIGSMLYDGYRQWRRYGKWDNSGMSWEQVWNKYEDQVLSEVMEEMMMTGVDDDDDDEEDEELASATASLFSKGNDLDDEELTARICLRILERSVATNEMVDRLFRMSSDYENTSEEVEEVSPGTKLRRRRERQRRRKNRILKDLQAIEKKFDDDIQELLQYSKFTTKEGEERRSKRKKGAFFWKKSRLSSADQAYDNTLTVNDPVLDVSTSTRGGGVDGSALESPDVAPAFITPNQKKSPSRKLASHEVVALRILATTKQRIQSLQEMKQDEEGQ